MNKRTMQFYSTNNRENRVSLQHAVMEGLASDNGLYMPVTIPVLPSEFFNTIEKRTFREIAFDVADELIGSEIPTTVLKSVIEHTIQFDAPVIKVEEGVFALELFHGPTLAFKDFGARFMSQLLGYYARRQEREIVILVATSGDTGGAVANGFLGVEGTKVVVLYPSGKVSDIQEKQFTTLGKNITALEVAGTFDDCQSLVKKAFLDRELKEKLFLTSANSINIARLIPQSFYYFYAYAQVKHLNKPVVFSVPSGNFGNLTAGLLAKRMGLPVKQFVACTNINDVVPEYLRTKAFVSRPSRQTISNAMDVGNPSNFARMLDLYNGDFDRLSAVITGYAFTDSETKEAMRRIFNERQYTLDPHGAVGYLGLKEYMESHRDVTGIFLETAHPGKFLDVVVNTLNVKVSLPDSLEAFLKKDKNTIEMSNEFDDFKEYLLGGES